MAFAAPNRWEPYLRILICVRLLEKQKNGKEMWKAFPILNGKGKGAQSAHHGRDVGTFLLALSISQSDVIGLPEEE